MARRLALGAFALAGAAVFATGCSNSALNDWSDEKCAATWGSALMDEGDASVDFVVHCCAKDPDDFNYEKDGCRPAK